MRRCRIGLGGGGGGGGALGALLSAATCICCHALPPKFSLQRCHSAMRTAFVSDGLARVSMKQLDVFDRGALPQSREGQAKFFMDITFDDDEDAAKAT